MAKECRCVPVLLAVMSLMTPVVMAGESGPAADAVVERLDRLERENQVLRERISRFEDVLDEQQILPNDGPRISEGTTAPRGKISAPVHESSFSVMNYDLLDPEDVFSRSAPPQATTDHDLRTMIDEALATRSAVVREPPSVGADDPQSDRIDALDKAVRAIQEKASKKTYPTVTVNGVFQADTVWVHQDSASEAEFGQIQDGSDFRRARLSAKGSVTETTNYFLQMDFAFYGRPTFTDLWVEQTNVPLLGNVRIGQWKQPFSLEVVSSFRYTTFMERSLVFIPFTPFRHIGIGFYDVSSDLSTTWAASLFRSGQDQFGGTYSSDGGYATAERLTHLPIWEQNGRRYLHIGAGHFFNAPPGDTVNFRTVPEIFVGAQAPGPVGSSGQPIPGVINGIPFFVATGNLTVPFYNVLGTELLWVDGPLSLQSEAMVNLVNQDNAPLAALPGGYAQVGWFLTGEHRPYDRKAGAIDRVIPHSNFRFAGSGGSPGIGAWELASRVSYLDLNDADIRGGRICDLTAGVNWYWNPYTKMVFNYIHSVVDSPNFDKSRTDFFGLRAQVDF